MQAALLDEPTDVRSDEALIAAINAGDSDAFDALYRRHRDWVVNLAFRFTGDRDLALDVLQETFLYLLRKFPGLRLTCQFRSLLYPAVKNLALAARRKAERCQSDGSDLSTLEANPMSSSTGATERERLAAALESLSDLHREVLLLRFVDGMSLGEIAAVLGTPLGTVKSRLHNALEALRSDERTREFFGS